MVDIIEIREDLIMNVASLNTLVLVYIGIAIVAVGFILLIFLGNNHKKKD